MFIFLKNVFKYILTILRLLSLVFSFVLLFILLTTTKIDEKKSTILFVENYSYTKHHNSIIGYFYSENKIKLDKNVCYTILKNELTRNGVTTCTKFDYESKLIKKGRGCYVYKLKLRNVLSKEEYDLILSNAYDGYNIVGNYNSGKKCKKLDYKECNVYLTEKGMLKYTNKYECK